MEKLASSVPRAKGFQLVHSSCHGVEILDIDFGPACGKKIVECPERNETKLYRNRCDGREGLEMNGMSVKDGLLNKGNENAEVGMVRTRMKTWIDKTGKQNIQDQT